VKKLPDISVWLALSLSGHYHHAVARQWLDGETESSSIYFTRSTQQGLVRLLSTEAILAPYGMPALTNVASWDVVERLLSDDRVAFANEPEGVEATWKMFALQERSSPKLWMDAWLAAFAIQGKYQLVTIDKAFKQFQGLDVNFLSLKIESQ
jgi:toxin-antitoxin system PIN domain toxin